MKGIFAALTLALSISTHGQNYYPFPDSNTTWYVYDITYAFGEHYYYYKYSLDGDTVINGHSYHKVYIITPRTAGNTEYAGGIREDSLKRIYFYGSLYKAAEFNIDSVGEYLFYQFGLNVGDTVPLYSTDQIVVPQILNIDSVNVAGEFRKRYEVRNPYKVGNDMWIEGIGSTDGLFGTYAGTFENDWQLYCFEQNGKFLYPDSNCLSVSINELNDRSPKLSISPNPAHTQLHITLTHPSLSLQSLRLFTLASRELFSKPEILASHYSLLTSPYPPGLYFLRITLSNGESVVKKLVIE